MTHAAVRSNQRYAWHGQSLLITNLHGDCDAALPISGFYFREARFLRRMCLRINDTAPWLCEDAVLSPSELLFAYAFPEVARYGGGGTGQSGDDTPRDDHDLPQRAIDIRLRYRVAIATLDVDAIVTNRSVRETLKFDLSWSLDTDFADIQETLGEHKQQDAEVRAIPGDHRLTFEYAHERLPYRTVIEASGADWRASATGVTSTIELRPGEGVPVGLRIVPNDYVDAYDAADIDERERAWNDWSAALLRVRIPGNAIAEATVNANIDDVASFPLLQGARDEWLAPQAGVPLYPALFGRDAFTTGWQAAMIDGGELTSAGLSRLARLQSDRVNDWSDEKPGRIPYQVRQGPLARLGLNPYAAYYADFASPMMFIIALAHSFAWSGDKAVVRRQWDTARRIMDWARDFGDRDKDGYLEYLTRSSMGDEEPRMEGQRQRHSVRRWNSGASPARHRRVAGILVRRAADDGGPVLGDGRS